MRRWWFLHGRGFLRSDSLLRTGPRDAMWNRRGVRLPRPTLRRVKRKRRLSRRRDLRHRRPCVLRVFRRSRVRTAAEGMRRDWHVRRVYRGFLLRRRRSLHGPSVSKQPDLLRQPPIPGCCQIDADCPVEDCTVGTCNVPTNTCVYDLDPDDDGVDNCEDQCALAGCPTNPARPGCVCDVDDEACCDRNDTSGLCCDPDAPGSWCACNP